MKILQVAKLWERVPPQGYGGVERVVSYLTEELVRLGHDVTLLASGDSITSAKLEAITPKALRLNTEIISCEAPLISLLERAFGSAAQKYDMIHSHLDFLGFPSSVDVRRRSSPRSTAGSTFRKSDPSLRSLLRSQLFPSPMRNV